MKLIVSANTSFNIVNFRLGLCDALRAAGHELLILAPHDEYTNHLTSLGYRVHDLSMDPRGTDIRKEVTTLTETVSVVRRYNPDAILSFTIKNNLYLGIAARLMSVPILPNVTGLGSVFSRRSLMNSVVKFLYRVAFGTAPIVFFQNEEDRDELVGAGVVGRERAGLLPGSGVSLSKFRQAPLPASGDSPVFLLAARMLWDKGVGEFKDAATIVRQSYPNARFQLLGALDSHPKEAVPAAKISEWVEDGLMEYTERVFDVIPYVVAASCMVLPTYYREGTPRVLLEAGAIGRPMITTDTPGCRNVVRDGCSGFKIPPRDPEILADTMIKFIQLSQLERESMAQAARAHIEAHYDEKLVIEDYRKALNSLTDVP
ncbi:MAG: glycosyltransferase family 4 protein [Pseudomonadota bacterium]